MIAIGLDGCATTPPAPAGEAAPMEKAAPEPAPRAEIPPQLMYDLLSADIAWQRGELEIAAKQYKKAAAASNDPGILKQATTISAMTKDYPGAIELAKRWISAAPEADEPRQALAMLLINQGEIQEPTRLLNEILGKQGGGNFMEVAALLGRQSNQDTAMQVMDGLIAGHSDNPDALFAYAHFAARNGKIDAALEKLDAAMRKKKNWPDAVVMRARLMQMRNENAQAADYLKSQLKGPLSTNYDIRLTYARMLMDLRQIEEAREQFILLDKQHANIPDVIYAIGLLDLQTNQMPEAEVQFTRLIEMGERRLEASYHLGLISEFKKDYDAAIKWFSAVTGGQFHHYSHLKVASLLSWQGKADAALGVLHELKSGSPQEKQRVYVLEGEILYRAKRYQASMDVHNRALQEMPNDTGLLYGRAMAAERLNLLDQAEKDLADILSREPENVQALNGLGYTLADRTNRFEEAHTYVKRALDLSPDDPAIIDSMGWVLYRMGKYDESIQHIQRAYDLLKDPEVAAHLGEVLWSSGQHDKALQVWRDALKQDPNDEILVNTMKRFGQE
ncbi:MAG: hypothetical protein A2V90_08035 [Gammaproteobacteria bacterium RBG_16_57_12]|nr:MAG: hypothetical protein A2V90_08035 [Gammaproteobacteria bacterium RBG_16_57_12]